MGAVKNHFHDEICNEADAARERGDPDEPFAARELTADEVWSWADEIEAGASEASKYAAAYAHRPHDARRYSKERDDLAARAAFLRNAWFGLKK